MDIPSAMVFKVVAAARQFFSDCIHKIPAIDKSVCIWAFGALHLFMLFTYPAPTLQTRLWKLRLQFFNVNLNTYTYTRFQMSNAVYLKSMFNDFDPESKHLRFTQKGHCYVGSTSIGAARRDFNRSAKLKQLQQRQAVQVELSLRYWADRPSFAFVSTIVIQTFEHYNDAWIQEHYLISRWQPALNHPFILRHLRLKATGWKMQFKQNQHAPVKLGPRLYQRIRRRLRTLQAPVTKYTRQHEAWKLLYDLSLNTATSFKAAQFIRSGALHDWEVYGLYRLSQHMEEPAKSKVRSLIGKALIFRNCTLPRKNIPLAIPFLAHPSFKSDLSRWLRKFIILHKDQAIPLHLPTHHIREKAFPSIKDVLHNHRMFEKHFDVSVPAKLPCICDQLRPLLRDVQQCFFSGHYVAQLAQIKLPKHLLLFQQANAGSTYFLAKHHYIQQCEELFAAWTKHHGLPHRMIGAFRHFLDEQWLLHLQQLEEEPRFTFQKVKQLKMFLPPHSVIHHGDHEQHSLTVFCPQLYFQAAWNTWKDPALFRQLRITQFQAQHLIKSAFTKSLQHRYAWGFRTKAEVPYAFIFPKRKKQFQKGRTLISYFQSFPGTLLKSTGRAIDSMLLQTYEYETGQQSLPKIWQSLHKYFSNIPDELSLHVVNDDLVGFFNSVPQSRLLDSVASVVAAWQSIHGNRSITVDTLSSGNALHTTFNGSFRRGAYRQKAIASSDIMDIVQAGLSTHIFSAVGTFWKQIQGAGIGSQISPSLSNLAVTLVERAWLDSFQDFLRSSDLHVHFLRYVDNRFALFSDRYLDTPAMLAFTDLEFYRPPVLLEQVEDATLLGFLINPHERTIRYIAPTLQQIRDATSSGSLNLRLSGLKSRAHLVRQYSYPSTLIQPALEALVDLYCQKGFPRDVCCQAAQISPQ